MTVANSRPAAPTMVDTVRTGQGILALLHRSTPQRLGILLVLPSLGAIVGLLFYPLVYSLVISFYDLHVTTPWLGRKFIGLGNYIQVLRDPGVQAAAGRTLYLAGVGIGLGIPLALAFALILNRP